MGNFHNGHFDGITGQEFAMQLITTQRMLHHILEKHDALPDRVSYTLYLLYLCLCSIIIVVIILYLLSILPM